MTQTAERQAETDGFMLPAAGFNLPQAADLNLAAYFHLLISQILASDKRAQ